jgi:hypothetical protein
MPQIMDAQKLLERITVNPQIFNGKPIIRGRLFMPLLKRSLFRVGYTYSHKQVR